MSLYIPEKYINYLSETQRKTVLAKSLLLILIVSIIALSNTLYAANTKDLLGQVRPDFSLPDLKEKLHSPANWKGKILVINFWATWCTPCLKEIPMFNRVQKEYAPDGVQFIGIAIDNKASINKFIQKTPIDYPVLYGIKSTTKLVQDYGNAAGVLPYTVFIDRAGKIQRIAPGQLREKYTRESIESML